ncbi:MAG: beta-ketoacyl-[acyl-carrier-protein] synthase family protein, partial [Desulfobacteraceae bacterium]
RRVVITGIGILSCLGNTRENVARSLLEGRSGIELVPDRKAMGFRSALSGTLKDFEIPAVPKRYLNQMGQGGYLAVYVCRQAIADAGLEESDIRNDRTGVFIGNGGNFLDIYEQCHDFHDRHRRLGGNALQRVMASSVSANLSVLLGTRGRCLTVASACASSASAVELGYQFVRSGSQDLMLCGGVQEGTWAMHCNFDALRVFSRREHDPAKASRPFDKYRDGLVPSTGAGMLVLEDHNHALSRGARIYAELIGCGTNSDGWDMTVPSGTGSLDCMKAALEDARIRPEDVDYINAHATSTQVGDSVEARALRELFGNRPYVSSTKSMTGHEIGAAGCNELIYTLLMMEDGFIAPNINIEEVDPQCEGIRIAENQFVAADIEIALSNSFGFGGVNTCIVLRKAEVRA